MLTCLHVRNMGLIDEVTLELHPTLNIFSGETGAGKSMLIDSIQFAIGNRTSKQIIRKGQQCAYVRLAFKDYTNTGIIYVEENGFPYEENNIILERSLYQSGRTVYKINGVTCTRQQVRELAALLIDVHGQHEPQSLLDVSKHLEMLDSFADEKFHFLKKEYEKMYAVWQKKKADRDKIGQDDRKKLQLKDMLVFQIEEIESCYLKPGEEEKLKKEYEILSHAEKIIQSCQKAYDYLESSDIGIEGATALTGKATSAIQEIQHINENLTKLHEQLTAIEVELQDVSYQIRSFVDDVDYAPERLEEVLTRLDLIYRLKQKYGSSIEEILTYKTKCEEELESLTTSGERQEALEKECEKLKAQLTIKAGELTLSRRHVADDIQEKIDEHLRDLQMPYAKFQVAFRENKGLSRNGDCDVEFMIRTNLGEDMHPLSKIASGGEISRVMLAIKTIMVLGDTINTVIFDEIDTGMSGTAAQKVAEKLGVISRGRQVICITHLPQIAAMGDQNFLIVKETKDDVTTTHLKKLEGDSMHQELCRLMGGIISESTLKSAQEIKHMATEYKARIS
ncbi:MAG: DNA repair protein RecN [Cellulosilyticaceae bacterium]